MDRSGPNSSFSFSSSNLRERGLTGATINLGTADLIWFKSLPDSIVKPLTGRFQWQGPSVVVRLLVCVCGFSEDWLFRYPLAIPRHWLLNGVARCYQCICLRIINGSCWLVACHLKIWIQALYSNLFDRLWILTTLTVPIVLWLQHYTERITFDGSSIMHLSERWIASTAQLYHRCWKGHFIATKMAYRKPECIKWHRSVSNKWLEKQHLLHD